MAILELATVDQVKQYLGVTSTGDDALFQRLISSASSYIQTWLNREFGQETYTEKYSGTGSNMLRLNQSPVTAVSSVSIDGQAITQSDGLVAGYLFDERYVYLRGFCFKQGVLNVSVTYTAGYSASPNDVTQACIEMVCARYKEKDRIGVQSKGLAGETISFSQKDMADSTRHLLSQYKKVAPN